MAGNSKGQGFKDNKPSIGKTGSGDGQPGGTRGNQASGNSSEGNQTEFLPSRSSFSGQKGGGPRSSGNRTGGSSKGNQYPFMPSKPEGKKK